MKKEMGMALFLISFGMLIMLGISNRLFGILIVFIILFTAFFLYHCN